MAAAEPPTHTFSRTAMLSRLFRTDPPKPPSLAEAITTHALTLPPTHTFQREQALRSDLDLATWAVLHHAVSYLSTRNPHRQSGDAAALRIIDTWLVLLGAMSVTAALSAEYRSLDLPLFTGYLSLQLQMTGAAPDPETALRFAKAMAEYTYERALDSSELSEQLRAVLQVYQDGIYAFIRQREDQILQEMIPLYGALAHGLWPQLTSAYSANLEAELSQRTASDPPAL